MNVYDNIVIICWIVFVIYWLISSVGIKKNRKNSLWRATGVRIAAVIIIFVLLTISGLRDNLRLSAHYNAVTNPIIGSIGIILCVFGIGIAFWARTHIGKNWGQPMTIKEQPELVTSGPYEYIRHPIYTGVILAMFGSALVVGIIWFIPFLVLSIYFLYSAKTEEKNMTKAFPKEYLAYMKRTKRLIPFLY